MSTVMYAFRASSDENLYEQIGAIKYILSTSKFGEKIHHPDGIDIQVFRTSTGIIYRVLEAGYMIRNRMWTKSEIFPTCNYDDRTDVPEEDLSNKVIVEEIYHLIAQKEYSIITLLESQEMKNENSEYS